MKLRAVKILQELLLNEAPVSINEFTKNFEVSDRTIRADINEINHFLKNNHLLTIETVRGKGIVLKLSNNEKDKVRALIKNMTVDYYSDMEMRLLNLLLEFAFGDLDFIYKKEDQFSVSKSTIDNDMKIIREIISEYGIELDTTYSESIEFTGSEKAIRVMIFNLINKYIGVVDIHDTIKIQTPLYNVLFEFIPIDYFQKLLEVYEEYIYTEDTMYKNQTILFIAIWICRMQRGNVLKNEHTGSSLNDSNIEQFINELTKTFNVSMNSSERSYGYFILETLAPQTVENAAEWTFGQVLTIELIDHVKKELQVPLMNQEELFSGLFKHIVNLIGRLENNMQIRNPLTNKIKVSNPEIFKAIESFRLESDTQLFNKITDDEIAFIAIYFLVSISQVKQENTFKYKAIVFCNHGKATGNLLAQKLREYFEIDVVAILSASDLVLVDKIDADIIFSTIDIDITDYPLLVVDSLLTEDSLYKIERFLEKNKKYRKEIGLTDSNLEKNSQFFENVLGLIQNSNGTITEETYIRLKELFHENNLKIKDGTNLPSLKDILTDEVISFDLEARDWEEAISKTAQPLFQQGKITENYIQAMIASVKKNGPYIVMGPHVALPHAKPEDGVKELSLSVSYLKEPVEFGHSRNDPVKVIFCISPIDSYTHINLMKEIFELMNNPSTMEKLLSSKNKNSFKQLVIGK